MLAEKGEIVIPPSDSAEDIRNALVGADAIIVRGPAVLTADLIDGAKDLKVISASGSGTDYIDVAAATRRGIPVLNAPGVASRSVVEWAIGAMICAHRGFLPLHERLKKGPIDWVDRVNTMRGTELTGTTLGIVGFGAIGQQLARIAKATFDANVIAYDPQQPADVGAGFVERVSDLNELLMRSLTVAVHVPLTPSTRRMLRREHFRRIGHDGVLVNAARGGVVDETELVAALKAGELKAAAMDVFENEPPSPEQVELLTSAPGMLLTPHVAGATDQAFAALSRNAAAGVIAVLEGRRPKLLVNPQIYA